jgi:hypothetical protein
VQRDARIFRTMPEQYKSITGLVDDLPAAPGAPQFSTAEYKPQGSAAQLCAVCGRAIGIRSYVVDSKLACARCAGMEGARAPGDSHAVFMQSLLFGAGAAIIGLVFYSTFTIVTHFYFGYVALAVGWLVGKAMMMGSRGVGGARYQISAVIFTYAAISLASVPILIARALQSGAAHVDWSNVAGQLVLWGIASPFLQLRSGVSGAIGLVILFVGLRIAYRITAARQQTAQART